MVASGASHASGLVPDPGVTAGTTKFLREDGTWIAPLGGSGISFDVTDGVASNTATLGNDLFNINYTTTGSGSAPGAFINSKSKGGSATATGLTVTADGAANGTVIKGIVINTNSSSAASPTTGLTISSSTSGAANATGLTVSASGGSINPAIVVGTSATADGWVQYASNLITNNAANNSTPADSYSVYKYTGVAATGVTMPGVATAGKTVFVINATAGNMTVNIAGAGTVTINQNRACMFISDGTNWFPTQN